MTDPATAVLLGHAARVLGFVMRAPERLSQRWGLRFPEATRRVPQAPAAVPPA